MSRRARTVVGAAALAVFAVACSSPVAGTARLSDRSGDTLESVNSAGQKPKGAPRSADFSEVRMEIADGMLTILLETSGTVASDVLIKRAPEGGFLTSAPQGPQWYIVFWNAKAGKEPTYVLGLTAENGRLNQGVGTINSVSLCRGAGRCGTKAPASVTASYRERTIGIRMALDAVPDLGESFTWLVQSAWTIKAKPGDAWGDTVPDLPPKTPVVEAPPEARGTFPEGPPARR